MAAKKKHWSHPVLIAGRLYRYRPPAGGAHPRSCMRLLSGRICMLLRGFGTFVVVRFNDGGPAWITAEYLETVE